MTSVIAVWVVSVLVLLILDYLTTQSRPDWFILLQMVVFGPLMVVAFIAFYIITELRERNKSASRKKLNT
jgi:Na+/melibiose symporter-like transporter